MIVKAPSVLLPKKGTDLYKWSVIACDQFTSEPEYWQELESVVEGAPSTLNLIYPEVYLGKNGGRGEKIRSVMRKYLDEGLFTPHEGYILVDRTCSDGKHRMGIMAEVDLEKYDYNAASETPVRASEMTVVERLPVRIEVRRGADLELPHIMMLMDNRDNFMRELYMLRGKALYDTDLNMGGGHVTGYELTCTGKIDEYMRGLEERAGEGGIAFAVGDGNHSLATAKACWEEIKATLAEEEKAAHPARFCLCEIVSVQDPALVFEPIHRVVFDSHGDFVNYAADRLKGAGSCVMISGGVRRIIPVNADPAHGIAEIQSVIDGYIKENPQVTVDYVHGAYNTEQVAAREGGTAIIMPLITKENLFSCVKSRGTLPRKSFSMGEGRDKRYYFEARIITDKYKISDDKVIRSGNED
ncbi:MAG TPA: DUF1015 domain-containing protein [Firmicutes bacterium]|nr:DUF1015 domain-containing protein [Bacillota bacterium]